MKHPAVAPILFASLVSLSAFAQTAPASAQIPQASTSKIYRAKAPILTLTGDNLSPSTGQAVRFAAAWDREVSQMTYHFDFGDGQSTDTQQLTADHSYSAAGSYIARVSGRSVTGAVTHVPPGITSNELSVQVVQTPVLHLPSDARKIKVPPQTTATGPSSAPSQEANPPVLTLSADTNSPEPGQSVRFIGTWDRNVRGLEYLFTWGDGQTTGSREPVASHAYAEPGTYPVRVSAQPTSVGAIAARHGVVSNELLIHVTQPPAQKLPVLTVSADSLNPQTGVTVHFTGQWNRKVPPGRYVFDFGDGQSSQSSQPVADHFYVAPGSYRVRVTANVNLESRTATGTSEIVSNELLLRVFQPVPPPVAAKLSLSAAPLRPQPNQRVHFTASFDQPVGSMRYRYVWGDGEYSDSEFPETDHAYSSSGTYAVHVLAKGTVNGRNFAGQSNEISVAVLSPPPPPPPRVESKATLKADRRQARVGDPVRFTASLTPQSPSVQYHFVFGDGNQQDSQTNQVVYSYARAGGFRPWVTISIDGRETAVTSPAIPLSVSKVQPSPSRPDLNVEVLSKDLLSGRDILLKASLDPPHHTVSYRFDWGDGSPPSRAGVSGVASHRYAQKGHYPVLISASTEETYPAPVEKSLILIVSRSIWPLTLGEWLLILAAAGVAVAVGRRLYNRSNRPPKLPSLHVTGFPDLGTHTVRRVDTSVPHLSLTLKPGIDSAEHEVIIPKRAAASD